MTPSQKDMLVAAIRAIESDIANPVALQESIQRDEAAIVALQARVAAAKDRAARLPELLSSLKAQLAKIKTKDEQPKIDKRIAKLQKLLDDLKALKGE